ncbi:MAG: hypothetical protein AAGN35_17730 [Bacteroidota bacterium]
MNSTTNFAVAIRLQQKSDLYVFTGYVLVALALAINPFTVSWWQEVGFFPKIPQNFLHGIDVKILLPLWLDLLLLVTAAIIIRAPRALRTYLNDSFPLNFFLLVVLSGILLSSNVILPGKGRLLRILFVLLVLFVLTNTLYLAVVKKEAGREVHPFYRNLGVALYGLGLIFLLLEIVFMFFLSTHRFNGTLASRAWFIRYWELNEEGYRDVPVRPEATVKGKRIFVLGDSFVAGHGVAEAKDRFSDRLQRHLDEEDRVYNLGLGGSDVRDALARLREYPLSPDLLVFSYYPNDIERDGEEGGLTLLRPRSYNDVILPLRFFIRRSYTLNYLYWQFPHPDEMSDYLGYLEQCYSHPPSLELHFARLDSLVDYCDSQGIPTVGVVFPLLEMVDRSGFATEPVVGHLRRRGVPVVDVRSWAAGYPAEELVVNPNDPHPGELLHGLVADSLYALLQRNGYLEAE